MASTSRCFFKVRIGSLVVSIYVPAFRPQFGSWCLTKLLKLVMTYFQSRGIHYLVYLDNLLIFCDTESTLRSQTYFVVHFLESLCFVVTSQKSALSHSLVTGLRPRTTCHEDCIHPRGDLADSTHGYGSSATHTKP
ncbi:Hypothetical predicted protein [Pelobates cultripes]|uniref:Reverse transcriptase n=1 Tax=Pelobates cultripes TaxID=61616 RepID=A0AAD1RIX2_PELCU|nr:Hypothetical predicted protein [Pelobates cultripes]